jgi:N-methylhydantoinase A
MLSMQRLTRPRAYDLEWVKPEPLVPRSRAFGVTERVDARGAIAVPLDEEELRQLIPALREADVQAVAVSFLFSFLNPQHELRAGEILAHEAPDLEVSLSHRVFAQWREYERTSTTVIDAYLKPVVRAYADDLARLGRKHEVHRLLVMRSNGGTMLPENAGEQPVSLVRSGPAGGVIAASAVGKLIDQPNLIVADMGGTSFDTCLLVDGTPTLTSQAELEWGIPIATPMVDVRSIGAGGGSIAWLDGAGGLKVGPASAGAHPGPASYGRGGTEPTVTDANLALGRLDRDRALAGDIRLDATAAEQVIGTLAERMGREPVDVAAGIVRIADNNMAQALRLVSVDRGHDPRHFAMIAFGGAGPLHAAGLARLLRITRIVIPVFPGAFSALGCLMAEVRFDYQQTTIIPSTQMYERRIAAIFSSLTERACRDFRREGYEQPAAIRRLVEMRYVGQNWEVEVELPASEDLMAALARGRELFERTHEERFGWHMPGERYELVNFKIVATAAGRGLALYELDAGPLPSPVRRQAVHFHEAAGFVEAPVYQRDDLRRGNTFAGPAVVAEMAATTLVPPGWQAVIDRYGNIVLDSQERRERT